MGLSVLCLPRRDVELFFDLFEGIQQIIHWRSVGGIMAGMHKAEDAVLIHDEVTAELGCIVAVGVVELTTLKPTFDIHPYHARMIRAQARAFELIGLVNCAVTIKQNIERAANFFHPLIESGERSKRDNKDAGIQLGEFILVCAQLCGMFAAGYSTKVTEENQQGVSVFENFAEGDLFTVSGLKGEGGGGSVEFECHMSQCRVFQWQVSDFVLPRLGVEGW